jgi:hypothetical protein
MNSKYDISPGDNVMAAAAFNNPWFAIGSLLGNAWSNQYNQRGEKKLYDATQHLLTNNDDDPNTTQNLADAIIGNANQNTDQIGGQTGNGLADALNQIAANGNNGSGNALSDALGQVITAAGGNNQTGNTANTAQIAQAVQQVTSPQPTQTPPQNNSQNTQGNGLSAFMQNYLSQTSSDPIEQALQNQTSGNSDALSDNLWGNIGGNIGAASDQPVSANAPEYTIDSAFPGMVKEGNVDIANRPSVQLPDGSIATVRSINFEVGKNGENVLIPTIGPNGENWTNEQAIQHYKETGENLGYFKDDASAEKYAEALHQQQDKLYVDKDQPDNTPNLADKITAPDTGATGNSGTSTETPGTRAEEQELNSPAATPAKAETVPEVTGIPEIDKMYAQMARPPVSNQMQGKQTMPLPTPFSVQDWVAAMWKEGKAEGRPDNQIQTVIDELMPRAQAAETNYNKQMGDVYLGALSSQMEADQKAMQNGQQPDMTREIMLLTQLMNYQPDKAKALLQGEPTMSNQYGEYLSNQNKARDFNYQQLGANNDVVRKKDLIGFNAQTDVWKEGQILPMKEELLDRQTENQIKAEEAKTNMTYGAIAAFYNKYHCFPSGAVPDFSKGQKPTEIQQSTSNLLNQGLSALGDRNRGEISNVASSLQDFYTKHQADMTDNTADKVKTVLLGLNSAMARLDGNSDLANQYAGALSDDFKQKYLNW